jgi:subtilisin family serine protease
VSVTQANGTTLQGKIGLSTTVTTLLDQPANGYDYFDGTSMSAPHVAGVAALIWSKYQGATNVQVRQALDGSAEDLGTAGRDTSYGYGLVRAKAALDALTALNPTIPTDVTAPIITNATATVTNNRSGLFQVTWTTNEPATSDVQLGTEVYSDNTLGTLHVRTFRGRKGATYTYWALSADAAGNTAVAGPMTITIQ